MRHIHIFIHICYMVCMYAAGCWCGYRKYMDILYYYFLVCKYVYKVYECGALEKLVSRSLERRKTGASAPHTNATISMRPPGEASEENPARQPRAKFEIIRDNTTMRTPQQPLKQRTALINNACAKIKKLKKRDTHNLGQAHNNDQRNMFV